MNGSTRRRKTPRVPRTRLGTAAALLAWILAGCGLEPTRQGSHTLAELEGEILYDEPFLVVPNSAWGRRKAAKLWYFGHSASVLCHVNETPAEPVVFGLLPRRERDGAGLEYRWDGQDVSELVTRLPSGEIQVAIPREWLSPGTHVLTFRQEHDPPEPPSSEDFRFFRYAGYRLGGKPHVFDTRRYYNYRYASNLLSFGLTGSFNPEMLGGFVSSGPRSVTVDLGTERGGLFQVRVLNSGAGPAVFRVSSGRLSHEVTLEPHRRRHLRVDVPRRERYLELSVEGDPNGYFLWGAPYFRPRKSEPLPPVVLVTLDTTRRDALGVYGDPAAETPHLDALAAEATVFDNAYTTAPWTIPAHASLFTGLYPSRHGAGLASDHLEIGAVTLAELLRSRGYLTAGFAGGLLSSPRFGVGQGFSLYRDVHDFETRADVLTSAAAAFLEEAVAASDPPPPFFLFVNYFDPHFPYRAPERFRRNFEEPASLDDVWAGVFEGSSDAWEKVVDGEAPASPAALEALAAAYRAEVTFMDEQVGELLARLREWDLYDEALIVVTADHGELLGEGGRFSHSGRLDEELVAVPLIVKWPGTKEARRDGRLVSLVDLFPTVLELAGGLPEDLAVDGLALRPDGTRSREHTFVVAEEHDTGFHQVPPGLEIAKDLYAVLGSDERRVTWNGGDLCSERKAGRWHRLSCGESRLTEAAAEARRSLEASSHPPRIDRIGLSHEEEEKLRALGYVR